MTRFRSITAGLMTAVLAVSPCLAGQDPTPVADWQRLMKQQMQLSLSMHFSFLAKDVADLMVAIGYKIRARNFRLAELQAQTQRTVTLLNGADQKLLRELTLMSKEADLNQASSAMDLATLEKGLGMWKAQCSADRIRRYKEFDYGNLVPLNRILADLNKTINEAIHADAPFSIGVSYGSGYGFTVSSEGGMGSNDWKAAVKTGCTALGAAVGSIIPALGTAVGAAIGWAVGEIVVGIITGGESIYDILADHFRDEAEGANTAFVTLKDTGPASAIVTETCRHFFDDATNVQNLTALVDQIRGEAAQAQVVASDIRVASEGAAQRFNLALVELEREVLPKLPERFDQKFEAYLDELAARSKESKELFKNKISPLVKKAILAGDEQVVAQQALWTELVSAEARFTQSTGFAWDANSKDDGNVHLQYWDAARGAVVERLKEAL